MKQDKKQVTFINSSGDRPYRLLINVEDRLLRTKLGGNWIFKDSSSFWTRVIKECRSNGLQRALVMFQLSEQVSGKDAYAMAGKAVELFSGQAIQLAVVDLNRRSFSNPDFWQMAAETGSFSSFFQSLDEAEGWLQEGVL